MKHPLLQLDEPVSYQLMQYLKRPEHKLSLPGSVELSVLPECECLAPGSNLFVDFVEISEGVCCVR